MRVTSLGAMMRGAHRWVWAFSLRHPWIGPTLFVASALYFFAQIVVAWVWHPPYSLVTNTISDLGNSSCGTYRGMHVCSPRHVLMNLAFVLLGAVMASGSLLIYQEFTERNRVERVAALLGFVCLGVAGLGTVLVGIFPENTVYALHLTGATLAIGVGNVGILILGLALPLPDGLRRFMLFFGTLSLTAAVLFASHRYFGIGEGTMERVAAYPETVWLISFGLYISRNHYRLGATPVGASPGFFGAPVRGGS